VVRVKIRVPKEVAVFRVRVSVHTVAAPAKAYAGWITLGMIRTAEVAETCVLTTPNVFPVYVHVIFHREVFVRARRGA
jgi:hypothetical protein